MWAIFQLAKTYSCRPSVLLGIEVQPTAYYFDRAVGVFGIHLERELADAESKGKTATSKNMKRKMVLSKYLGAEAAGFAKGPTKGGSRG